MKLSHPEHVNPGGADDDRLQEVFVHLTSGQHTTSTLAAALGVSPATAFRLVKALRRRGHHIVSMKEGSQWFFAVRPDDDRAFTRDPLIRARGTVRGIRWPKSKTLNEAIDEELYGNP